VFQPYSGVKTSILILDKSLAKQSDSIAFFKVENDGYGLGAQRRAIDKNDLPAAAAAFQAFRHSRAGTSSPSGCVGDGNPADFDASAYPGLLVVDKARIAANGDYNLSGERYREGSIAASSWPFVPVGEVFRKGDQTVLPESLDGPVTYLGLENITQNTGAIDGDVITAKPADIKSLKNVFKPRDILYGKLRPNLNKVWLADRKGICSTDIFVIEAIGGITEPALYAYLFRSARFNDAVMSQLKGAQLPRIGWSSFAEIKIPLPPLEVQKEIVAEIEGYQKVIDGARAVLDHYRPHIPIHPDWPMVPIGELCTIERGASPRPIHNFITEAPDGVNWIKIGDAEVGGKYITATKERVTPAGATKSRRVKPGDFVLSNSMSFGRPYIMATDGCIHDGWLLLRDHSDRLDKHFLYNVLGSTLVLAQFEQAATGGVVNNLNSEIVRGVKIPLPPLATQQAIVAEIEAEQALVAANRELITRFEQKIQATLARVWGEVAPGS
jgi:type I restriction enzyme M protein